MDALTVIGYGMGTIMFVFAVYILLIIITQPHDDD